MVVEQSAVSAEQLDPIGFHPEEVQIYSLNVEPKVVVVVPPDVVPVVVPKVVVVVPLVVVPDVEPPV